MATGDDDCELERQRWGSSFGPAGYANARRRRPVIKESSGPGCFQKSGCYIQLQSGEVTKPVGELEDRGSQGGGGGRRRRVYYCRGPYKEQADHGLALIRGVEYSNTPAQWREKAEVERRHTCHGKKKKEKE
ncbi:hypothetical protein B0H16DRAFT_1472218 [Mycena metata]|uniref:Uncharacterized protein n=1 Tax=Mycena metata TaxID=1033252 RepID=A0AAD7HPJ5_9AGAR|nr:hypothetical protein B0H16DRAFT_1472218 [Mycena metata]